MKRFVSLTVGAAVLVSGCLSGCKSFGDDNAATIDGKAIAASQVTGLAKVLLANDQSQCTQALAPAQLSQYSAAQVTALQEQCQEISEAVVDSHRATGKYARQSLQLLVQFAVAEDGLRDLKETITTAERTAAASQVASLKTLSKADRGLIEEGLAAQSALQRAIVDHFDSKLGRAVLDAVYASQPSWDNLCGKGIIGLASDRAAVDAEVAKGTTIEELVATPPTGFQLLGDGGKICTPKGGTAPAEVLAGFADTSKTAIQSVEFDQAGSDATAAPTKEVVFFVAGGEQLVKRNSAEFKTLAAQSIQQAAQAAQQGGSSASSPVMPAATKLAVIKIDPRFGSGYNLTTGIVSPVEPLVPTTTTAKPTASTSTGG